MPTRVEANRWMTEPSAQRTLVKSPPELWAEISDVESLARHLGAFGEIRITRMQPETTVAWEGDVARGTVELKAAGWGTKVTLTATPTAPAGRPDTSDAEAAAQADARSNAAQPAVPQIAVPDAQAADEKVAGPPSTEWDWVASAEQKVRDRYMGSTPAVTVRGARHEGAGEGSPKASESELPQAAAGTPEVPRAQTEVAQLAPAEPVAGDPDVASLTRGPFARLRAWFTRSPAGIDSDRASTAPAVEVVSPASAALPTVDAPVAETDSALPEPSSPVVEPDAAEPSVVEPDAGEPAAVVNDAAESDGEAGIDEGTIVGILTGVLDELGSAHHRPFSRS